MKRYQLSSFVIRLLTILCVLFPLSTVGKEVYVPDDLKDWEEWVLHRHPQLSCPRESEQGANLACAWIRKISVDVVRQQPTGATFRMDVDVFVDSHIELPYHRSFWPHDVLLNGKPAVVGGGNKSPKLRLPIGLHEVTGQFSWNPDREPSSIRIPQAGLVSLSIDSKEVTHPRIENGGQRLWLSKSTTTKTTKEADAVKIKAYRHLIDDIPQYLDTYVRLTVTGSNRIINLGQVLPDHFELIKIESKTPATLGDDGSLNVQVTRGKYWIILRARSTKTMNQFFYRRAGDLWPNHEIWGFEPKRNLRVVRVEGAPSVNLNQVGAPERMLKRNSHMVGFSLSEQNVISIVEEQRGNVNPNPGKFTIERDLWLSFSGDSLVAQDRIFAITESDRRISADYVPGKVNVNDTPRLITFLDPETKSYPGINLDKRSSAVEAVSLISHPNTILANGWNIDSNSLSATLHLPPGWRLLWTHGVDEVTNSWLSDWLIWDVFIALLLIALVFKIAGIRWASIIAIAVLLIYQDNWGPTTGWLVLAALIYLSTLMDARSFQRVTQGVYWLMLVPIATSSIYFSVMHARMAIFPQFENKQSVYAESVLLSDVHTSDVDQASPAAGYMKSERVWPMPQSQPDDVAVSGADIQTETAEFRETPVVTIQTGPGTPKWEWHNIHLSWSGPVAKDQTMSFVIMPPWLTRIVYGLAAIFALMAVVFFVLIRISDSTKLPKILQGIVPLLAVITMVPSNVEAHMPDQNLLSELERRLTGPPECVPNCAHAENIEIRLADNTLTLTILMHAEDEIAAPLPFGERSWLPKFVTVDNSEIPLLRRNNNELYVLLNKGKHIVEMSASVDEFSRFDIRFPLKPSLVDVLGDGWITEGISDGRLESSHLSFIRKDRQLTTSRELLVRQSAEPFVSIHRHIRLDYEPKVSTTVKRIAPLVGSFTVTVPLLPGETVTQTSGTIKDGSITLSFSDRQTKQSWRSDILIHESLELAAPDIADRKEEWLISGSDFWHFEYSNITPTKSNKDATVFHPRSNETLRLDIKKPLPVPGNTITVEGVNVLLDVGHKTYRGRLYLTLNASQHGEFTVELPENLVIQDIQVGAESQPIPASGDILLPVNTGQLPYVVEWQTADEDETGLFFKTPVITLEDSARNINLQVNYPSNRWTLFLGGPSLGAAVRFWGTAIVIFIVAVTISRLPGIPFSTVDAILLSLGATLANLWALLFAGVWFISIWWRMQRDFSGISQRSYRLMQLLFVFVSVVAVSVLIYTVPIALLGQPDMQIAGNHSTGWTYHWFADESGAELPTAWVFSFPMWAYRLAMLGWSLWLAFALLKWIKAAWTAVSFPEFWPSGQSRQKKKQLAES